MHPALHDLFAHHWHWREKRPDPFCAEDIPNEDWVKYGKDIKSAASFERNLEEILNLAQKRQEPVLMSTFAFYVPRDYSYFKFRTHQLDYGEHTFYIEVWGKPEHVILGTLTHNAVMRKLAAKHPEIMFLDEYPRIPTGKGILQWHLSFDR